MRPIFLIGYMASGKTTLGRAAGKIASMPFVDLDEYVEAVKGLSVTEIFEAEGETGFRIAERDALRELGARNDIIIACGGGTPCFHGNMEYMNRTGLTIRLETSRQTLLRRLSLMKSTRPLIADKNDDELERFINESLEKRMPYYSLAAETFAADRLESEREITESVSEFVSRFITPSRGKQRGTAG